MVGIQRAAPCLAAWIDSYIAMLESEGTNQQGYTNPLTFGEGSLIAQAFELLAPGLIDGCAIKPPWPSGSLPAAIPITA